MGRRKKPRLVQTHLDWISIMGSGEYGKKGPELLKILFQALKLTEKGKRYSGYSGGWYYQQFVDLGLRISANDDAQMKLELQGTFWNGGFAKPYEEMLNYFSLLKQIDKFNWKLTRVDVAKDLFGVSINDAFPNPKKSNWDFSFTLTNHLQTDKDKKLRFTGYTARKQRWSLTVYDKRFEIDNVHQNAIKQTFFKKLSKENEPITRVELRIKTAEALGPVQGIIQTAVSEVELCQTILKHWADYHRIKTQGGNDEWRFKSLLRSFDKVKLKKHQRVKREKIYSETRLMKLSDIARGLVRDGIEEGLSLEDILNLLRNQHKWLSSEFENFDKTNHKGQETEGDQ